MLEETKNFARLATSELATSEWWNMLHFEEFEVSSEAVKILAFGKFNLNSFIEYLGIFVRTLL